MNNDKSGFFLVREEILPEAIKKTIRAGEMLRRGDARTINEAVEKMELAARLLQVQGLRLPVLRGKPEQDRHADLCRLSTRRACSSVLNTISADSAAS